MTTTILEKWMNIKTKSNLYANTVGLRTMHKMYFACSFAPHRYEAHIFRYSGTYHAYIIDYNVYGSPSIIAANAASAHFHKHALHCRKKEIQTILIIFAAYLLRSIHRTKTMTLERAKWRQIPHLCPVSSPFSSSDWCWCFCCCLRFI